jgi:hypothetical protein
VIQYIKLYILYTIWLLNIVQQEIDISLGWEPAFYNLLHNMPRILWRTWGHIVLGLELVELQENVIRNYSGCLSLLWLHMEQLRQNLFQDYIILYPCCMLLNIVTATMRSGTKLTKQTGIASDPHFAICRWTCRRIDEGVPLIQDRIFKFVAQRLKWIKFSATKSGCIKDSEVTCYLQHLKLTSSSWIKRKLHHVRFFPGVPSPTFGYLWDSSNASRSIPGRSPAMEGKC